MGNALNYGIEVAHIPLIEQSWLLFVENYFVLLFCNEIFVNTAICRRDIDTLSIVFEIFIIA